MAESGFTQYSHRDFVKQLRQLLQDRYTWDGDGFSILKELVQNANDAGATRLDLGWVLPPDCPAESHSRDPEESADAVVHPLLAVPALDRFRRILRMKRHTEFQSLWSQ